jgi:hypothetical protein
MSDERRIAARIEADAPPKPPDLGEWVARYGGYHRVDWIKWDAAVAEWREKRCRYYGGPVSDEERKDHARKHKRQ